MERFQRAVCAIGFACIGDFLLLALELSTGVFSGIQALAGAWWLLVAALLVLVIAIYGYNGGYAYATGARRIGRPRLPRLGVPLRMVWPQVRYRRQYSSRTPRYTVEDLEP